MAKKDDPEFSEYASGEGTVSLAEAATAALSGEDGSQGEFDETQSTKVKFVGMGYDAFEESIKIGDEITFLVRTRCVGVGDEIMKSAGTVRHTVKMDVQSVVPQDGAIKTA